MDQIIDKKSVKFSPGKIDDRNLHFQFAQLGVERKRLTNKLILLIPEILKRKIYLAHGCTSISEYCWKFAGLSKLVVEKVLRTEKYLENKPNLKNAIETAGIHKVAMIARIASANTENFWAEKVVNMSKASLQELSKEMREKNKEKENQSLFLANGEENFNKNDDNERSLKCSASNNLTLHLDAATTQKLLKLQKEMGCATPMDAMRQLLKIREREFEKKVEAKLNDESKKRKNFPGEKLTKITRYIPVSLKREILEKTNYLCSYPNCNHPAEIFHHRERFSSSKSHQSIVPLCKTHHEFMHHGIVENEIKEPKYWRLNFEKYEDNLDVPDKLYLKYKNKVF